MIEKYNIVTVQLKFKISISFLCPNELLRFCRKIESRNTEKQAISVILHSYFKKARIEICNLNFWTLGIPFCTSNCDMWLDRYKDKCKKPWCAINDSK